MVKKTARRQSGDGALYQRKADGMWVGSIELGWTPEGRRRRKVVVAKDQRAALAKLREVRKQVGLYGDVPTATLTLEKWLTRWLDEIAAKRVRPRTLDTYRHKVDLIVAASGQVRLDKLSPAHVRAVHALCESRGLSSTTALQAHAILSKALTDAMREGLVVRNVATLVDRPRKAANDRGALTAEQAIHLLRANADDPMVSRWAFALAYGVRQGEALGLRWQHVAPDHVDLAWQLQALSWRHGCGERDPEHTARTCPQRNLGVPSHLEHVPLAGQLVLTRPKTKAGIRVLPLVPLIEQALTHRRAVAEPNRYDLVWTEDDKPWSPTRDSAAWHAALERADLPRVPLHTARHTAATLLLEAGVDTKIATQILGHSDVLVTRAYQHGDRRLVQDALERVSRMLEAG